MCLAATQDFAGIGAVRFLLGFTEGAVAPSFMIITSNWYCRREHPVRIAYVLLTDLYTSWHVCNCLLMNNGLDLGSRCLVCPRLLALS